MINGELIENYPIGFRVRLKDDYPDEGPRKVAGHKNIFGFDYLLFEDGYMAYIGRVVE